MPSRSRTVPTAKATSRRVALGPIKRFSGSTWTPSLAFKSGTKIRHEIERAKSQSPQLGGSGPVGIDTNLALISGKA